jgi:hypothetical protein
MPPAAVKGRAAKFLLDQDELNLGVSKVVVTPRTKPFNAFAIAAGNEERLLDLACEGRFARTVSITFAAFVLEPDQNSLANTTGPITGIVEYGNGAVFARVEFDIPAVSRLPGLLTTRGGVTTPYPNGFKSPAISGVTVCVAAGAVRTFARNDNNLPLVYFPERIIGSVNASNIDPTVSCSVAYGETFGANRHLKKTIYIVDNDGFAASSMAPGDSVEISVPPFAKTVRFPRTPVDTTTLGVIFDSYFGPEYGTYAVPAGGDGPFEIPPDCFRIKIANTGATSITRMSAIFDLAI